LFKIAGADALIKQDEMDLLERVAQIINLDDKAFAKLKKQFTPKPINKKLKAHYDVLGVSYDADLNEIKSTWKKLIVIYHPDKLTDASDEEKKAATDKMAAINLAYQEIVKVKGKK
jgi:DnaJ-class molecular chaperone